jgi:hypothetical protein
MVLNTPNVPTLSKRMRIRIREALGRFFALLPLINIYTLFATLPLIERYIVNTLFLVNIKMGPEGFSKIGAGMVGPEWYRAGTS